jgi:hypothetical protein
MNYLGKGDGWLRRIVIFWQLVEQDHIEQRFMHLDTAVVTHKTKLAKAVHEEAHTGPRGADHIRQCLLCNRGDEGCGHTRLAEFRHQQENPRKTLFAGIEKLIDKIGLDSHTADQQKFEKYLGKS